MQYDKVVDLVEDAKRNGARILSGGEAPDGPGFFYPVTIIADVTDGMSIVDEEQFGPVLPVIRYTDLEDAIARANGLDVGLGGSAWSSTSRKRRPCHRASNAERLGSTAMARSSRLRRSAASRVQASGWSSASLGLKEYTSVQVVHQ